MGNGEDNLDFKTKLVRLSRKSRIRHPFRQVRIARIRIAVTFPRRDIVLRSKTRAAMRRSTRTRKIREKEDRPDLRKKRASDQSREESDERPALVERTGCFT